MSRGTQTIFGMAGVVLPFAGAAAPSGWLLCNGAAISRTTFAHLFSVIGTTHGAGDGSTTFNLPDLRGEFIRGLDAGRGVDPGRVLGNLQYDMFKSHNHPPTNSGSYITGYGAGLGGANVASGANLQIDNSSYVGGTETRPRNVALNHIIKV